VASSGIGVIAISASVHGPVCAAAIVAAGVGVDDAPPSTIGVSAADVGDASGVGDGVSTAALVVGWLACGAGEPEQEYEINSATHSSPPSTTARRRQYTVGGNGPTVSLMMTSR
jgi:hypothetical protein